VNPQLFEFVETTVKFIAHRSSEHENIHVYFLFELAKYLGISPQKNFSENCPFFDMCEGRFTEMALPFPLGLDKEDSAFFSAELIANAVSRQNSNSARKKLLGILLMYYRLHIPGFNELKSLDVVREIML